MEEERADNATFKNGEMKLGGRNESSSKSENNSYINNHINLGKYDN